MNTHPYLRAFMAGVFVPTLVLPLILTGFIIVRLVLQFPIPIERGIVFPMALVPSLFGLWNIVWLISHVRTHLPIGLHGAILPLLMAPVGALVGYLCGVFAIEATGIAWFQVIQVPYLLLAAGFAAALAGYYLVWKYIVGFLNRVLGIA